MVELHDAPQRSQSARQQSHDGLRGDRLAGPGFSNQTDKLAGLNGKGHIVKGVSPIAAARQSDRKSEDLQNRGRHYGDFVRGSSASRRPSPSMFTASTVTATKSPGNRIVCG